MSQTPPNLDAPTIQSQSDTAAGNESRRCASTSWPVRFGRYELLEQVAKGGMGVVFRARQLDLNRTVAVKMIIDGVLANDDDIQRFLAEAESAAHLDHAGIVPIYEVGQHDGRHFFSMAFVDGESLAGRLTSGPLESREAASLIADVADAIEYAHGQGVIHRDLKPGNILLDQCGRPRVTDFGVAKQVSSPDRGLTIQGELLGTPSYMPPEQARGDTEEVGFVSDVYSLGAILYAALTGRPPFQSATQFDTINQVIHDEVIPLRRLNSRVPTDLETITLKCLEKSPARRYQTAAEVGTELRRYLDGKPILARPPGAVRRVAGWFCDNMLVASMSGITTIALVAGMLGMAWRIRMEMERNADLVSKVDQLEMNSNLGTVATMQGANYERRWRLADAHRLCLLARRTYRKDRQLALLLAAESCDRLEEANDRMEPHPVDTLRAVTGTKSDDEPIDELIELARKQAGREFTDEEKQKYLFRKGREDS